ncbi:LptF/LptG family permease [bacterium]|nr:LptF/LptG family permease [bacterium]MBU1989394.1 LptF/LptG family permease [bacterium]
MLAFRYISFHYLKYFSIILLALVLFLVGFDYMENAEKLSESANLVLIYLVYKSFFAIDMLLPLALIFSMISTKIFLIRSNALVSFYSLGYSRIDVLRPFVVVSTSIIILFVSLHALPSFSRADEFSNNIRKNAEYLSPTRDLFFTYKDQYVYFSKMLPLQEKAEDIRVFTVKDNSLKEVLVASEATYRDEHWYIRETDIITKPDDLSFESMGMKVTNKKDLKILEGFRPKILDQVYEGKVNFTIKDAIDAIFLLKDQNVNISSIKGALYKIFVYPFFVPCLVVIIFFFVPISPRFLNVSLFSFAAILATLLIWGILFMLIELSNNKIISSEVGVLAPVIILFFVASWQWRKFSLTK